MATRPKNRNEYREAVAQAFIDSLNEHGLEWSAGWSTTTSAPQNAVTKAKYHGINSFYLRLLAVARGYTDPRWATMTQIMDRDGKYHPKEKWHLQKGSKAEYVEYWYPYDTVEKKMVSWADFKNLTAEERADPRYILRVRYTAVFHASMIDGIKPLAVETKQQREMDDIVQQLSQNMGVELLYDGQNQAFYRPSEDKIHLPSPADFVSDYELNATALHELTHATGHESRLNRLKSTKFGSEEYAYEELVAEIGSALMGVSLDVDQMPKHLDNHKAYVQSWISAIQDKPETLMSAIADAQRAADYMDLMLNQEHTELPERSITVPESQTEMAPESMQHDPVVLSQKAAPSSPAHTRKKYSNYIAPDLVALAKQQDVLDVLRRCGEPMTYHNNEYRSKEHDSLVITEGKGFYWFSQQRGSKSAIDYFMWTQDLNFVDATKRVLDAINTDYRHENIVEAATVHDRNKEQERGPFKLPQRAENDKRAFAYLVGTRKLNKDLVAEVMGSGDIYQDKLYGNVVFVGKDYDGKPVSAFKRSTLTYAAADGWTRGDEDGSQKDFRFRIENPESNIVNVFEAEIDLLSYLSLRPVAEWSENYIALGGVSDRALTRFLEHREDIRQINICTDNDAAGNKFAQTITDKLQDRYEITRAKPIGKDWNEDLVQVALQDREDQRKRPFAFKKNHDEEWAY